MEETLLIKKIKLENNYLNIYEKRRRNIFSLSYIIEIKDRKHIITKFITENNYNMFKLKDIYQEQLFLYEDKDKFVLIDYNGIFLEDDQKLNINGIIKNYDKETIILYLFYFNGSIDNIIYSKDKFIFYKNNNMFLLCIEDDELLLYQNINNVYVFLDYVKIKPIKNCYNYNNLPNIRFINDNELIVIYKYTLSQNYFHINLVSKKITKYNLNKKNEKNLYIKFSNILDNYLEVYDNKKELLFYQNYNYHIREEKDFLQENINKRIDMILKENNIKNLKIDYPFLRDGMNTYDIKDDKYKFDDRNSFFSNIYLRRKIFHFYMCIIKNKIFIPIDIILNIINFISF